MNLGRFPFLMVNLLLALALFSCTSKQESEIRQILDDEQGPLLDASNETPLFELLGPETTNIQFTNKITETKDQNIQSFAYMYNGGGVAIGDINNDGLQDILLGSNQESCRLYLNKGDFQFEDITLQAGLELFRGYKTGVNMADVNGDGFLDIYICSSGFFQEDFRNNLLYINNGDATFTEKAEEMDWQTRVSVRNRIFLITIGMVIWICIY